LAVKLLYYSLFVFVGVFVFLLYKEPYYINLKQSDKPKANLEANRVTNYSIQKEGVVLVAKSSQILRYKTYDKFFNIDIVRKKSDGVTDNLKAKEGSLRGDLLRVSGDIRYADSNGIKFFSDESTYNLKSKVFKSLSKFTLETNSTTVFGSSLVYQVNDGKIFAHNVKSISKVN